MFSSFSSYLFGNGNDCDVPSGKENELITVETDGDWLLVETHRQGSLFDLDEEESRPLCEANDCNLATTGALTTRTAIVASTRRMPSLPSSPTPATGLEGSWYITPPSCFTAGPPCHVQTSPLENLLIEHPSMSVYAGVDAGSDGGEPAPNECQRAQTGDQGLPTESGPVRVLETKNNSRPVGRPSGRRQPSVLTGKLGLLEQIQNQADVQKLRQRQQTKLVHRKQLERLNKAQEFQSHGKRHRRKDFVKTPSGKSNNRKF